MKTWLATDEWRRIQQVMPIICVDILPIRFKENGRELNSIGLILRNTPHEGKKWCTVGGRLLYGESIQEGIDRQLRSTLGDDISFSINIDKQLAYIAQYSPVSNKDNDFDAIDPRQHAVGLTYSIEIKGSIKAHGEAITFQWFSIDQLRDVPFGFNQDRVINKCLERFKLSLA